jgi:hypothetical protein
LDWVVDAKRYLFEFHLSCESVNSRNKIEAILDGHDCILDKENNETSKKSTWWMQIPMDFFGERARITGNGTIEVFLTLYP